MDKIKFHPTNSDVSLTLKVEKERVGRRVGVGGGDQTINKISIFVHVNSRGTGVEI